MVVLPVHGDDRGGFIQFLVVGLKLVHCCLVYSVNAISKTPKGYNFALVAGDAKTN